MATEYSFPQDPREDRYPTAYDAVARLVDAEMITGDEEADATYFAERSDTQVVEDFLQRLGTKTLFVEVYLDGIEDDDEEVTVDVIEEAVAGLRIRVQEGVMAYA